MGTESVRTARQRGFDIAIAALLGGLLGGALGVAAMWLVVRNVLVVDRLQARSIVVTGELGTVEIAGDSGISLNRNDYAAALLWFHAPGTGSPGTGGPALWLTAPDSNQAFQATPSSQATVPLKMDDVHGM